MNDSIALREFFLDVLPNHDEDRVYVSDIKKILKWYNLLLEKDLLSFEDESKETEESETEEAIDESDEQSSDS
jgi:hypothetical protein